MKRCPHCGKYLTRGKNWWRIHRVKARAERIEQHRFDMLIRRMSAPITDRALH